MDLAKHITWKVEQVTWEEIFPIWQNELWPERPWIRSFTTMINNEDHDMSIKRKAEGNRRLDRLWRVLGIYTP